MSATSPHGARSRARTILSALVIALGVTTSPLPTTPSHAAVADVAGVADRAPRTLPARRIAGWVDEPRAVRPGSTYVATVRVAGGRRPVLLQRRLGAGWRTVATSRSTRTGRAALRWQAPRSAAKVALRVRAPRAAGRPPVVTRPKTVVVRRPQAGTPGSAVPSAPAVSLPPLLAEVFVLVNAARLTGQRCGRTWFGPVPPVRPSVRLNAAAAKYARAMAERNHFSHTGPNGSSPGDRIEAEGYDWRSYGENIAAGQETAAHVVKDWIESEGHCRNIMGRYAEIGLGHAYDADSYYGNYWVQEFATR